MPTKNPSYDKLRGIVQVIEEALEERDEYLTACERCAQDDKGNGDFYDLARAIGRLNLLRDRTTTLWLLVNRVVNSKAPLEELRRYVESENARTNAWKASR